VVSKPADTQTCATVHCTHTHHIFPKCFGHSCYRLQGGAEKRMDTSKYSVIFRCIHLLQYTSLKKHVYSAYSVLYSIQSVQYTVQYTICTVYYNIYSIQSVQYTLYSQYGIQSVQCTVCTVYYTIYSIQSVQHTVQYTVCTVYCLYSIQSVQYTVCTVYSIVCTVYSILYCHPLVCSVGSDITSSCRVRGNTE
jgi:hypothetical protein